jgi:3'-phosphoadenosine 5'-phosphosulfate sulfotransferase (PAPS reductase)/FAD synthetase
MNLTFEQKIIAAENVIHKAYEKENGNLFISFSGGKDSTILRHIALKLYPNLKVVFSNTTNELAEVLKYIKTFPNIITVTPNLNFKEVVQKHGFPLVSKEVSQKVNDLKRTNGKITRLTRFQGSKKGHGKLSTKWKFLAEMPFDITHKCCQILKKDPLDKWSKQHNLKPLIALMSGESRLRQQLSLYGSDDDKKIYPFLKTGWSDNDIWEYATLHNIRFAECYYDRTINDVFIAKRERTGCEYCAFGITLEENDRFERSKLTAPKRYKKMMNLENNGVKFSTAINLVKNKVNRDDFLDLHGFKPLKGKINYPNIDSFHLISTTKPKCCPHCESKDFKDEGTFQYQYLDLPSKNGNKRELFVDKKSFQCNECKLPFDNDIHLFNNRLMITKRLEEYILNNLDKKSSQDLITYTGLDLDSLFDIAEELLKERRKIS